MIEFIQNIDQKLLLFFNGNNSPFMDAVMYSISSKYIAIPLYLYLIYLLFEKFKKNFWKYLLLVIISVAIADLTSVYAFKEVFQRLRPCHNPELSHLIHSVYGKCGGSFGFVSSHATNNFALAGIFMLILGEDFKAIQWFLVFWAIIVSFSRVYLGVHYPTDVIGGAALGLIISLWIYVLFKKLFA